MSEQKQVPSKTINHLKSYPIVTDFVSLLTSSTIVASLFSNLKPFATYVQNLVFGVFLVQAVLARLDEYTDLFILNNLDKLAPSLKQVHLKDVDPRTALANTIGFNDLNEKVKGYEKQIRPTVSTRVDPIIKPLNNKLESLIESYLPKNNGSSPLNGAASESLNGEADGVAAGTEESSTSTSPADELARFYYLTASAYQKTIPEVTQIQKDVSAHILQTYSSKLPPSEQAEGAKKTAANASATEKLQAAVQASIALSNEALDLLEKNYGFTIRGKVKPYQDRLDSLKSHVSVKVSSAKNEIDALVDQAAHGVETATVNGSSHSQGSE